MDNISDGLAHGLFMFYFFLGFIILVLGLLALDLGVFHRKDEAISTKSALWLTFFWIILALLFNGLVYLIYQYHWLGMGEITRQSTGYQAAITFFTAYLVEKSLSIDNIFVIAMIFDYFKIPSMYQHRVLFWGILGALILRGLMIAVGIVAISYFTWLTYVLGALLIVTAIRMLVVTDDNLEPENNLMVRIVSRWFLIAKKLDGHNFFTKLNGKAAVTHLFLALLLIESTDLFFAIDSIPAVLAITLDPFIVFTSNVFAILGMRSLYFALASLMDKFRYLKTSLVFILGFVGAKMILVHHIHIDPLVSLAVIISILSIGVIASVITSKATPRS